MLDDWMLDVFKLDGGIGYSEANADGAPAVTGAASVDKSGICVAACTSGASADGVKVAFCVGESFSLSAASGSSHGIGNMHGISSGMPSMDGIANMLLAARAASSAISSAMASSRIVMRAQAQADAVSHAQAEGAKLPLEASEFSIYLVEELRVVSIGADASMDIQGELQSMSAGVPGEMIVLPPDGVVISN